VWNVFDQPVFKIYFPFAGKQLFRFGSTENDEQAFLITRYGIVKLFLFSFCLYRPVRMLLVVDLVYSPKNSQFPSRASKQICLNSLMHSCAYT
jgi:hypothetical protein